MGGTASMLKPTEGFSNLFISTEMIKNSKEFTEDKLYCQSFVDYVKSGSWLDKLSQFVPETHVAETPVGTLTVSSCISRFNLPPHILAKVDNSLSRSLHIALSDRRQTSRIKLQESESAKFLEDYINIDTIPSFTSDQLCCIMFGIVHPIYMMSVSQKNYTMGGQPRHPSIDEDNSVNISVPQGSVQTAASQRAQELLHGCAAFFEGSELTKKANEDWVANLTRIFDQSSLAIGIVDISKTHNPLMYVNHAFEALFEFKSGEATGKSVNVLHGTDTEPEQKRLFSEALRTPQITRLWITHNTKTHRSVVNLMTVLAVHDYSLCVYIPVMKKSDIDKLPVSETNIKNRKF